MPKRNLIWILSIVAAAVVTVWVTRPPPHVTSPATKQFDGVLRTYRLIREEYYREVDEDDLGRGAVRGMVEALDEFTTYIRPEDVDAFNRRVAGERRGLGLRIELVEGRLTVVGPLKDSPAHKAGVRGGDRIIAIDGAEVDGLGLPEIQKLLTGEFGAKVELELMRRGADEPRTVTLTRSAFPVETIQGLCRTPGGQWIWTIEPEARIAYVRITEFVRDSAVRLRQVVGMLATPGGLILDLRDNPGGLPETAVETANLFLSEGVILRELTRKGGVREYAAHADGTYPRTVPIVVLVNARSASGAEIVAGALKMHHRAVLLGTRTRGKGCVQSMRPLPVGLGQINLTTKEFLLASGHPITRRAGSDVWGVDPHTEIILKPGQLEELRRLRWRAEVLPASVSSTTRPATVPATQPWRKALAEVLAVDAQLAAALRLMDEPEEFRQILDEARRAAEAEEEARRAPAEAGDDE